MKQVRAHIDGWSFVGSVGDMQSWWDNLKAKNSFLPGTQLKVWEVRQSRTDGAQTSIVYDAGPVKVFTM